MALLTGKTSGRWTLIKVDDMGPVARDISVGVKDVSPVGLVYNEKDVTGYGDAVVNYVLGHPNAPIDMTCELDTTADTGAYTVIAAIVGDMTITHTVDVAWGIRQAATETGEPQFDGEYYCASLVMNGDATFTSRFVPASSTAPAFGVVA
jgi:hypothetical protein